MKPLLLIATPLTAWAVYQLTKTVTGAPWFRCLIGRHYYGPWIEADFKDWINSQPTEGRICACCGRVQLRAFKCRLAGPSGVATKLGLNHGVEKPGPSGRLAGPHLTSPASIFIDSENRSIVFAAVTAKEVL